MYITNYKAVKLCEKIKPYYCPLCGEVKQYYIGTPGGVEGFEETWFRRRFLFFGSIYRYSMKRYRCDTCGARWETKIVKNKVKVNYNDN